MKIAYYFPNGYAADITAAREKNDFDGWINRKFGDRIRTLISDDFTIESHDDHFEISFPFEDDAFAFLALIGGREIDE